MEETFKKQLMEEYINKIKDLREKIFIKDNTISSDILNDENSKLFNFTSETGIDEFSFYTKQLNEIKSSLLIEYFVALIKESKISNLHVINNTPILSLMKIENGVNHLYYFKNYGLPTKNDNYILRNLISKFKISKVHLISLTIGNSKNYSFNNSNLSNLEMRIEDFFISLFNIHEYNDFISFVAQFSEKVKNINSISTIKPLTDTTKYYFIKNINSFVLGDELKNIIKKNNIGISNQSSSLNLINSNFYDNERYRAITRKSSFSDSIVTAEWMYESLKNISNIDYSVISLGYFKALEQFLYELVKSHSKEDRKIKRMSFKELDGKPDKIYLNNYAIKKGHINFMLDSLITFINDYPDIFDNSINIETINHITALLDRVKKLRNGYFHKDNMTNWDIVVKSREVTYLSFYYLLGALNIEKKQMDALNIPNSKLSNFTKICEYIHYNKSHIFRIKTNEEYYLAAPATDNLRQINENNEPIYSGAYMTKYLNIPTDTQELTLEMISLIKKDKIKLNLDDSSLTIDVCTFTPFENGLRLTMPYKNIYKKLKYYE